MTAPWVDDGVSISISNTPELQMLFYFRHALTYRVDLEGRLSIMMDRLVDWQHYRELDQIASSRQDFSWKGQPYTLIMEAQKQ